MGECMISSCMPFMNETKKRHFNDKLLDILELKDINQENMTNAMLVYSRTQLKKTRRLPDTVFQAR